MTVNQFYQSINTICNDSENRDLEEYFLALLALVERERKQEPTAELMLQLLREAFTAKPAEFDPEWLKLGPPDDSILYVSNVQQEEDDEEWEQPDEPEMTMHDYTVAVLKFQIGEFHSMRGKQLENPMRGFGLSSDSGHDWYNFDPFMNLECGARCLLDGSKNKDAELQVDWSMLGELLEMGRIYE
ncbi:MAG: hypothetical protein U0176_05870 [Bacteroidia bacterium]